MLAQKHKALKMDAVNKLTSDSVMRPFLVRDIVPMWQRDISRLVLLGVLLSHEHSCALFASFRFHVRCASSRGLITRKTLQNASRRERRGGRERVTKSHGKEHSLIRSLLLRGSSDQRPQRQLMFKEVAPLSHLVMLVNNRVLRTHCWFIQIWFITWTISVWNGSISIFLRSERYRIPEIRLPFTMTTLMFWLLSTISSALLAVHCHWTRHGRRWPVFIQLSKSFFSFLNKM